MQHAQNGLVKRMAGAGMRWSDVISWCIANIVQQTGLKTWIGEQNEILECQNWCCRAHDKLILCKQLLWWLCCVSFWMPQGKNVGALTSAAWQRWPGTAVQSLPDKCTSWKTCFHESSWKVRLKNWWFHFLKHCWCMIKQMFFPCLVQGQPAYKKRHCDMTMTMGL